MGARPGVRLTWRRRQFLRTARSPHPDGKDAGRARPERRNPRRGRGSKPAARIERAPRRPPARRARQPAARSPAMRGRRCNVDRERSSDGEEAARCARAARTAITSRFVVLTGVSGSGKSQAIRALEDLGISASTTCRSPCCRCWQSSHCAQEAKSRARPSSSTCAKANC